MERPKTQYYKNYKLIFNHNYKYILSFFGQWPTQSSFQRKCIRCLILANVFSIFIPKMIKFCKSTNDIDVFLECIPMLCLHTISLSKFFTWIINYEKTKVLLDFLKQDRNNLQLEKDLKIMKNIIKRGRIITAAYSTSMFSILVLYLASPVVPKLLDMIKPLNTSRNLIYLYQTEYFVDPDEYYIPILIHAYCTVPISVSIIVFFDNVLAMYVLHACGMFSILRSYLRTIHLDAANVPLTYKDSNIIYKNIVQCVHIHRKAIEFSSVLESFYSIEFMIILFINLLIITLTGIVGIMKLDQFNEGLKYFAFCIGAIFHLLYSSYQGQTLIEQSEKVFTATYFSEWYTIPPHLQQLLIPIMMRNITPCRITAGKIVDMSMETFSIVLRNAMSFFTVLSSTR